MKQQKHNKTIIILGGGYAGVNAALRLRLRDKEAAITLVNERTEFIERIRNHQAAAGEALKRFDLRRMLGTGVNFVEGRAEKIDTAVRQVLVKTPTGVTTLAYDALIYALGSGGVTHATANTYQVNTRDDAEKLRADLSLRKKEDVVIVGAGLTGLELATELRQVYPTRKITLADRKKPGSHFSAKAQDYLNQTLAEMQIGFEMLTGDALKTAAKNAHTITVNCTGFTSPDLAAKSGIACDERNRVLVNEYLQAVAHPAIFVAGDAAAYGFGSDSISYTGCATANPMGTYCGEAVAKFIAQEKLPEFHYGFTFQCISLGRQKGIIQFLDKHTGKSIDRVMTGKSAAVFKELICKLTIFLPKLERKTGWPFYTWRKTRLIKRIGQMASRAA